MLSAVVDSRDALARPHSCDPLGRVLAAVVLAGLLTACGSPTGNAKAPAGVSQSRFEQLLADAAKVTATDFEPVRGRALTQIAALAQGQAKAGLATSVIEPG